MDDDSPDDVAHRVFAAQRRSPTTRSGRDPAGDRDTCRPSRADDVRAFFAQHYRAESMVVAARRTARPRRDAAPMIERCFAGVAPAGDRPTRSRPVGARRRTSAIDDDTEQVHIVMGGRSLARNDARSRGARRGQPRVRRRAVEPAVRGDPRAPRSGLLGVLRRVGLHRLPACSRCMPARSPSTPTRCSGLMHAELAAAGQPTASPTRSSTIAVGYLTGAFELGLEDTGARMARNGGQLRHHAARSARSTSRWPAGPPSIRPPCSGVIGRRVHRRSDRGHRRPHFLTAADGHTV